MIEIVSVGSSSSGNSYIIMTESRTILVDAGLPAKRIVSALEHLGTDPADVDAVLITHEHIDHCKGLPQLMKSTDLPVYTTRGTFEGLARHAFFARLPKERFHLFRAGDSFELGRIRVKSLPVRHDTREPVAYRLEAGDFAFACVTDLGCYGRELTESLQGLSAMVLEANHNRRMLETGPYPYPLKRRIL